MSTSETTRVTEAIARNVGIRWCATCQRDKPAASFVKLNASRMVCADCMARRTAGKPAANLYGRAK